MARTKWKKIITAGPLVKEVLYPGTGGYDAPKTRAGKKRLSTAAQQRMNAKYSYQKLELMLAANFKPGDIVATFTYDDDHLPYDRRIAEGRLKAFRARLSAQRRQSKQDFVMFWCTEGKHGDGRLHHHVVINATGNDFVTICALWGQGEIHFERLRVDKEKNYETLARYMAKEDRERVGQRAWSYTRGASRPEVETFRVEEDTTLEVPKGATALEEASERTEFGYYKYVKYMFMNAEGLRRTRARRRKR